MEGKESIQDFYERKPEIYPTGSPLENAGSGHFNVYSRSNCAFINSYRRRDFYKISLVIGEGNLHYADRWIRIERPALLFSNPLVPYAWEATSADQQGYFCLFTGTFIQPQLKKGILEESPLFKAGGQPLFFLPESTLAEVAAVFLKMIADFNSEYPFKYDLLRNYVQILVHEALKLNPAQDFKPAINAAARITHLFLELLGRQFPIESPEQILRLKTAQDYASQLAVHTNHLNRAVKDTTGETTTQHIARRIIDEAKALLLHTDWSIAEIAYSLGFEYVSYFNNFYRKHVGETPGKLRTQLV